MARDLDCSTELTFSRKRDINPGMRTVLVVANTENEFADQGFERSREGVKWTPGRIETPETTYLFMKDPEAFKGYSAAVVQFWGTWYDREDIEEMKKAAIKAEQAPF